MMDESISSDEEVSASASTFARQRRIEQRRQGIKRRQDDPDETYGSECDKFQAQFQETPLGGNYR
jgi:hypothetical protein